MNDKRLLTQREWNVEGTWYAPLHYLRDNFNSVVYCEHSNTTNSAGDWEGVMLQRLGNTVYAIPFCQENNHPNKGFTLSTLDVLVKYKVTKEFTDYRELFEKTVNLIYN